MMKILLFVACVVAVASGKNIRYKVCPNTPESSTIKSVDITPCDAEPCTLHKGTTASIAITFFTSRADKEPKAKITAKVGPAWIPYPGADKVACKNHGIECPLDKSHQYVYTYSLEVLNSFPSISTVVSWELTGDTEDVVCIEIPVKVA